MRVFAQFFVFVLLVAPFFTYAAIDGSFDGPNFATPNQNNPGGVGQQADSDSTAGGVLVEVEYADNGLVTCQGPDCDACDLVNMVNGIINFIIVLLTVLATIVLVIAGFKMVTSGGNASAWQSAKESFFNIVIGFILVLAAWLIVDTILKALTGTGLEVWGVITC